MEPGSPHFTPSCHWGTWQSPFRFWGFRNRITSVYRCFYFIFSHCGCPEFDSGLSHPIPPKNLLAGYARDWAGTFGLPSHAFCHRCWGLSPNPLLGMPSPLLWLMKISKAETHILPHILPLGFKPESPSQLQIFSSCPFHILQMETLFFFLSCGFCVSLFKFFYFLNNVCGFGTFQLVTADCQFQTAPKTIYIYI